ncbi:MAG: hypothetical protein FJ288_19910 [Planctomycetes bacterium]|nr:hypothetical protein [Planctomycetota bacterium]
MRAGSVRGGRSLRGAAPGRVRHGRARAGRPALFRPDRAGHPGGAGPAGGAGAAEGGGRGRAAASRAGLRHLPRGRPRAPGVLGHRRRRRRHDVRRA